jgi:methionyl-tRNA formyltransferase
MNVFCTSRPQDLAGLVPKSRIICHESHLSFLKLKKMRAKYVFFVCWHWIIPKKVYDQFHCVAFHMTDLPFGRGGSPLQNLLLRGIYHTKLSAFKVGTGFDRGPVYLKEDFCIGAGSAGGIYRRAHIIAVKMAKEICKGKIIPVPQVGKPTVFYRRSPWESRLPETFGNIAQAYDFIRMLDADGYPKAFVGFGRIRAEFNNARKRKGIVVAKVVFKNE